jgi:methyl-accepting chemotaxis protein
MLSAAVATLALASLAALVALAVISVQRLGRFARIAARAERAAAEDFGATLGASRDREAGKRLVRALAAMSARHRAVLAELAAAADALEAAGGKVRASATTERALAERQGKRVAGVAASAEELSRAASVAEVHAKGVVDRAGEAGASVERGLAAVLQSDGAVAELRGDVERMARTLQALAERGALVEGVVAAANDVADQAHVLSLNATLEAAVAGEHGRGFGVVAGEMRALAERSRAEMAHARSLLGEFQAVGAESAQVVAQGRARAAGAAERAALARASIEELAGAVAASSQAAHDIAGASREQGVAIANIVDAVVEARGEATKRASSATATIDEVAQQIGRAAARLRGLVGSRSK